MSQFHGSIRDQFAPPSEVENAAPVRPTAKPFDSVVNQISLNLLESGIPFMLLYQPVCPKSKVGTEQAVLERIRRNRRKGSRRGG